MFLDIKKDGSPTWKAILKALEVLKDGFMFNIGDEDTNIWFQPWFLKNPPF